RGRVRRAPWKGRGNPARGWSPSKGRRPGHGRRGGPGCRRRRATRPRSSRRRGPCEGSASAREEPARAARRIGASAPSASMLIASWPDGALMMALPTSCDGRRSVVGGWPARSARSGNGERGGEGGGGGARGGGLESEEHEVDA